MLSWKRGLMWVAVLVLGLGVSLPQTSFAQKKKGTGAAAKAPAGTGDNAKISTDPGAATVRENRLLKWGPVDPPDRAKRPEYFVRGAFLDMEPVKDEPGIFTVQILPIEVVENEYRVITFDNFKTGLSTQIPLNKQEIKELKKGNVVELKNWYETIDQGGTQYARMIAYIYHQNLVPYPVTATAYLKKPGLDSEQYLNAIKAVQMSGEKPGDSEIKDMLDSLASNSPDPETKTLATQMLSDWFGAQPTGRALAKPGTAVAAEAMPTKKKK